MFIETVRNIAVNTDHLVKIWTVKESGKSSVPDQFVLMGQTIHGEDVFIRGFDTPDEANDFKAQVFEIPVPDPDPERGPLYPIKQSIDDLDPGPVLALLNIVKERRPDVYRLVLEEMAEEVSAEAVTKEPLAPKAPPSEQTPQKEATPSKPAPKTENKSQPGK